MTTWTTHTRELARTPEAAQAATEPDADVLRALVEAATSRSAKDTWCSAVSPLELADGIPRKLTDGHRTAREQ